MTVLVLSVLTVGELSVEEVPAVNVTAARGSVFVLLDIQALAAQICSAPWSMMAKIPRNVLAMEPVMPKPAHARVRMDSREMLASAYQDAQAHLAALMESAAASLVHAHVLQGTRA